MQGFTAGPMILLEERGELSLQIDLTLSEVAAYPVKVIEHNQLKTDPFFAEFMETPTGKKTKALVITMVYTDKFEC